MFYKHIISLLFLIITANSLKLDETTGDTLGQFSESEEYGDGLPQDKDDLNEINADISEELDETTWNTLEQLSESEEDGDGFLQDKDDWKDISSEISKEFDENLEEFLEEKFLEKGVGENKVMTMANFVEEMAHRNTLTVSNGVRIGSWGGSQYCSDGAYAAGYNLKIQSSQGSEDDTALNGIKLYCEFPDGRPDREIMSSVGNRGEWHGRKSCSRGNFLIRFQLQIQDYLPSGWWLGIDNTSANFARFKCRDLDGYRTEYQLEMPPDKGEWGTYGSWSMSCPTGEAICGLRTRVSADCGAFCHYDNIELNDAKFLCCN